MYIHLQRASIDIDENHDNFISADRLTHRQTYRQTDRDKTSKLYVENEPLGINYKLPPRGIHLGGGI